MPDLFPSFDVPSNIENESATDSVNFKPSIDFDFNTGDFTRTAGQLKEADGYDAWVQWCIKIVATPRYDCLAYSNQIGIEIPVTLDSIEQGEAETQLKATITDALLADPSGRTQLVDGFTFTWNENSVKMTCRVTASDGATATISATY
jgi:hypothetical protein